MGACNFQMLWVSRSVLHRWCCNVDYRAQRIKEAEAGVKEVAKRVNDIAGVKESDTGLAPPSRWDLVSDKQAMQEEQPLQVSPTTACCLIAW
jgi:hypothetical protein